jgi:uncharacterized protein Yka (UPF0111/DUF47 family)
LGVNPGDGEIFKLFARAGANLQLALAEAIDDVVDEIEEVSEEMAVYGIEAPVE